MKRVLPALVGALFGTALAPFVLGAGCAGQSAALRGAVDANNAAVAALGALRTQHEARIIAEYLRRSATCPAEAGDVRRACVLAAGRDTLAALAPEHTRLLELELAQQTVAACLEGAVRCKGDTTCEASALAQAAGPAARLKDALTGGAP